jgi:tetratricopeptide (TPR) repeat protein
MPAIPIEQAFQAANALQQAGKLTEAEAIYRQILAAQPTSLRACVALGNTLAGLGRWDKAVETLEQALKLDSHRPEIHFNLGNTHARSGHWEQAVASYRRALALRPDCGKTHTNLGSVLMEQDRLEEALAHFQRALQLHPDAAEMHYNVGVALARSGRGEEAIACYRHAIALRPDYADAHWALAPELLRRGHYEEGWHVHARYGRCPHASTPRRKFNVPQWDGSRLDGETILVHEEQGFGDTIQFLRYLPLLREQSGAGRIVIETAAPLSRMLKHSEISQAEIVERQNDADSVAPPCDRHIAFLDLPYALRLWEPLPMARPYLHTAAAWGDAWEERLHSASRLRIGLAWAGNPKHPNDSRRSLPPEKLLPLFHTPGANFYSLQIQPAGAQPVSLMQAGLIDLTGSIADFADTAGLIERLDLIITVDTAVAHLAGALGRPVWTLLPFVADWRWGLERQDTPWYPSMRLFRQPARSDWDSVIGRVAEELGAYRCTRPPPAPAASASTSARLTRL